MNQAAIEKERIELRAPGSPPMAAHVARPADTGPCPGLLLLQEFFAVHSHIRNVTDQFASQGFVAIAPELFHRTAPAGFAGGYNNFPSVMPYYQALTNEALEADVRSTYARLRSSPRVKVDGISCVGFGVGGRVAFLANRVVPMRSAVWFYGGGIAPGLLDRAGKLHGTWLLIWGGLDKHITADHRKAVSDALTANHKPCLSVEFSFANHAFFCDEHPAYDANTARQAWALTLEFLARE